MLVFSYGLIFLPATQAADYVETNNYAIASYNVKALTSHLTYEGYQAYCSAQEKEITRFTRNQYYDMELDFSNATVPLLRNSKYFNNRLNSVENYFGYIATAKNNANTDLLAESSALAKITDSASSCSVKVLNLLFIQHEYQKCQTEIKTICQKQCATAGRGSACVAGCRKTNKESCDNLHQKIDGSDLTTKEIIEDMESNEVSANPTLYSTEISPSNYCHNLAADQCDGTEEDYNNRQKIYKAIQALPFAFNNYYRTAYMVEAVKICPVVPQGDVCANIPYEYNNCTWADTPDIIRIYPFRIPDLLTNKNFCDQSLSVYPGKCKVDNDFPYFSTDQNYSDPATTNTLFLQSSDQQTELRNELATTRMNRAAVAQQAEYDNKDDVIYCDNCDNSNLAQALVKMINATAKNNQFNEEYLGEGDSDMSCAASGSSGESSSQITTTAERNKEQKSAFIEKAKVSNISRFEEKCCEEWEWVEVGVDEFGTPITEKRCKHWYYAKAKVRYWVVSPQGDQAKATEEQILGSLYSQENYTKFVGEDGRQNKRLALQNVANARQPLTILGAGPVTNIFIVQESLYDSSSGLYQTLLQYKNINEYFVKNSSATANGTSNGPGTNDFSDTFTIPTINAADKVSIMNAICGAFGARYGATRASQAIAVARAESGLNPYDVNAIGATGLFQIFNNSEVRASLAAIGYPYPGESACSSIGYSSNKKLECIRAYYNFSAAQIKNALMTTEYYKKYSDPATNISTAIAKYNSGSSNPWLPAWSTASGSNPDMNRVGRGNYLNNKNICVEQGGSVVYNAAGDCGQSGRGCL
ncbi:MAG: hypothetical protein Q4G02_01530 [bacterium]|nr:hypothetical protein [bacterium]